MADLSAAEEPGNTMFACKMCMRAYASTDAVRKHAKKYHPEWVRDRCPSAYATRITLFGGEGEGGSGVELDKLDSNELPQIDKGVASDTRPCDNAEEIDMCLLVRYLLLPPEVGCAAASPARRKGRQRAPCAKRRRRAADPSAEEKASAEARTYSDSEEHEDEER